MKEIVHVMFSREQGENRIKELADQINEEYGMTPLRLICIAGDTGFHVCVQLRQQHIKLRQADDQEGS